MNMERKGELTYNILLGHLLLLLIQLRRKTISEDREVSTYATHLYLYGKIYCLMKSLISQDISSASLAGAKE